jgi:hypothetical protein
MSIHFEVEWISPPDQGVVAARILQPQDFILTRTATVGGQAIHDVEPGDRSDLFAFYLEQPEGVRCFSERQVVELVV